jgi:hypothetical protein
VIAPAIVFPGATDVPGYAAIGAFGGPEPASNEAQCRSAIAARRREERAVPGDHNELDQLHHVTVAGDLR